MKINDGAWGSLSTSTLQPASLQSPVLYHFVLIKSLQSLSLKTCCSNTKEPNALKNLP